ncbi:hypothetical protein Tsubulata_018899 [Turnera subulata]|uniref:Uncharacterized protein n=1 Tax=Turnera subulata TaxID=218843 RepID=A0A9Q0G1S8_9ROSI|nr:hypothetical protein Tsubulata_018899 [Turnera subulata]
MAREKSPGLKILWVWTIGTAAILVGSVARNRIRDMEQFINAEQQQEQQKKDALGDSIVADTETLKTDDGVSLGVKS